MLVESKQWCAQRDVVKELVKTTKFMLEDVSSTDSLSQTDANNKSIVALQNLVNLCSEPDMVDILRFCGVANMLEQIVTMENADMKCIKIAQDGVQAFNQTIKDISLQCEEVIDTFACGLHTILVKELGYVDGGHGWKVWEASYVFAKMLVTPACSALVQGKRVLELGAGCGLPGLATAHAGASKVVLTDRGPNILANLRRCVELLDKRTSCGACARTGGLNCDVSVKHLDWNEEYSALINGEHARRNSMGVRRRCQFDLIIAADVLYTSNHSHLLCAVLGTRLAPDGIFMFMAPLRGESYLNQLKCEADNAGFHLTILNVEDALQAVGLPVDTWEVHGRYPGGVVVVQGFRKGAHHPPKGGTLITNPHRRKGLSMLKQSSLVGSSIFLAVIGFQKFIHQTNNH